MDPYGSDVEIDHEWLARSRSLGYPGHDIRVFVPEEMHKSDGSAIFSPALFGDLDPNPDGPDPDVWPLELDPGDETDELFLEILGVPAPHVRWVTDDYLQATCGYNPYRVNLYAEDLPPWHVPDDALPGDTVTVEPTTPSRSLTPDRRAAIQRFARLWNGEIVRNAHLLIDKIPKYSTLFGDLDYDDLRRLHMPKVDIALIDAFGDCDWFNMNNVHWRDTWILRKHCYYDPTMVMQTLARERDNIPTLKGDLGEGIRHRVGVGLGALYHSPAYPTVTTYDDVGRYTVDMRARGTGRPLVLEVMTGHHDTANKERTYRKLMELAPGRDLHVVFDTTETLKKVINRWIAKEGAEFRTGEFNTVPAINEVRKQCKQSAADPQADWFIDEVSTIDYLWRQTLGSSDPPSDKTVLTLDW